MPSHRFEKAKGSERGEKPSSGPEEGKLKCQCYHRLCLQVGFLNHIETPLGPYHLYHECSHVEDRNRYIFNEILVNVKGVSR